MRTELAVPSETTSRGPTPRSRRGREEVAKPLFEFGGRGTIEGSRSSSERFIPTAGMLIFPRKRGIFP